MDREVAGYLPGVTRPIDDIVAALDGMTVAQLNWAPDVPEANSCWIVAVHIIGSVEEAFVRYLGGGTVSRDRAAEFASQAESSAVAQTLAARWQTIKANLPQTLANLDADGLDETVVHPFFGTVLKREVLCEAIMHASGHGQEVALTRKLALAAG